MSQQIPPSLAGLLSGPPQADNDDRNELEGLQQAIDALHGLMVTLKDPAAVHQAATALRILTGLQQQMMTEQEGK